MPQVEITATASVKEGQKDVTAAAHWSVSLKDNFVDEYDGVKRVTIPAEGKKLVDVQHMSSLRTVAIENTTPDSQFRLRLRSRDIEGTDLIVGRFFLADVRNVDHLLLVNESEADILVRIFLAGAPSEA